MRLEDNLKSLNKVSELIDSPSIATDFVTSICGDWINEGQFRNVFEYNLDPENYVVKIELQNSSCNITEYMIWDEVKGLCGNLEWVKNWFAPVKWISPNGRILVMKRTKKNSKYKKPEKIPGFLWDIKDSNFGWIGKNYVCHDYGQFYNMINYPKKMIKTKWE